MALQVTGEFEVGRPAGIKPGTPIDSALAVTFGPLALEAGRRYQWRLSIDGKTDEDWGARVLDEIRGGVRAQFVLKGALRRYSDCWIGSTPAS